MDIQEILVEASKKKVATFSEMIACYGSELYSIGQTMNKILASAGIWFRVNKTMFITTSLHSIFYGLWSHRLRCNIPAPIARNHFTLWPKTAKRNMDIVMYRWMDWMRIYISFFSPISILWNAVNYVGYNIYKHLCKWTRECVSIYPFCSVQKRQLHCGKNIRLKLNFIWFLGIAKL